MVILNKPPEQRRRPLPSTHVPPHVLCGIIYIRPFGCEFAFCRGCPAPWLLSRLVTRRPGLLHVHYRSRPMRVVYFASFIPRVVLVAVITQFSSRRGPWANSPSAALSYLPSTSRPSNASPGIYLFPAKVKGIYQQNC